MIKLNNIIKEEVKNYLLEKEPSAYDRDLLKQTIEQIAQKENLAKPTRELDYGAEAVVFESTDPNILIRAEELYEGEEMWDTGEGIMSDYEILETGGVAEIYHIDEYTVGDKQYVISWKEKVEENFEHVLWNKYPEEEVKNILYALHLYDPFYDRSKFEILRNTPETSKLYNAIMSGLPTGDLAPSQNLGINKRGYIVAYDV